MPKKVTVPGVGVVSFPDAMSDNDIARAVDDMVAKPKPERYAGDPISKIEERKAQPPPNARGSQKPDDGGWSDFLAAAGEGLGSLAPNIFGFDPVFDPVNAAIDAGRRSAAAAGASDSGVVRGVRMIAPAVPLVGSQVADVLGPAQAVEAGRAPTHQENVDAVRSGTAMVAQLALPAAVKAARGPLRAAPEVSESGVGVVHGPLEPADAAPPSGEGSTAPDDAALLAEAVRRRGGASAAEFFQKQLDEDAQRKTPEAAIARAGLPLDEFVKARFPRATLTPDRDATWTKSILDGAQEGKPGFSIDEAPEVLKKEGIDRQLVYRDPDGKPVGVANVVDGEAGEAPLVRDFAVDKSQGLLAGRAAGAIASELERAGSFEHMKEISPDAARFVQKAEAYRARAAVKEGSPKPPGPGSGGGDNSDGSGGAPPPAAPPPAAPAGAGTPSGPSGTLPEIDSRDFGPALRTLYTGERDVRAAEANVLADKIRKLVPDHVDREALTLARDFKADPQKMSEYLNPAHPAYDGLSEDARAAAHTNMLKLQPVIERALDPTPEMTVANAALTSYFDRTLAEGKELGFLDSQTPAEQYINHLLQPKDAEEGVSVDRPSPSRMNRFTPNARERYYPTVLDAVANGVNPRTLDVADAVSIYGDKHGMAAATNILIDTLKMSDLGRFATDSTAPEGWAEVGAGTRIFRNEVPFIDEQGNPQVAHQALYAPRDVADALRPITDPDWTSTVPGFRASRMYQAYIKSVELGLSVFHMRALNITALNNEGLAGLVKSYGADVDSPQFIEAEKTFLKSGGTTSITGRTIEAYRAANPKSLPSTLDVIRGLPVLRQLDQFAGATSKLTFDIMQRKFKVVDFSIKNAKWIADHPNASPRELAAAQRSIAKEINSAYGGLNWEALGVNRGTHSLAKAIFLAPDWTFSNWQTAKTSFEGSPGGKAARAFWLRSAITGMALTQATSMLLSGRKSDNPTMVYLGKDKAGKGIYQNMFFAGAPADLVTLIGNVKDYGLFEGTALSLANKLAPFARMAVHAASNKNFLGQDIVPKGSGIVAGTGRAVLNLGSDVVPVPFSASNLVQMLTDRKRQYTPLEYLTTMLTGARSRHIKDERQTREKTRNSTWKIITGSPVYKGRE